jgi:hypothetical protein
MITTITVCTYDGLDRYAEAFMKTNGLRLMFLVSRPGVAKTWHIRKRVKTSEHLYVKAARLTGIPLFKKLYAGRNMALIFDDVDDALNREATRRLLMEATETDDHRRKVAWLGTENLKIKVGQKTIKIPQEFECKSRVCLVCNDWHILANKFGPLLDRGVVVFFEPSNAAVHDYVKKWFKDTEVFDFIGQHLDEIPLHSIRSYIHARDMKNHGLDWKEALLESWSNDRQPRSPEDVFDQIMRDPKYTNDGERIEAFEAQTGCKRRCFYNYKKQRCPKPSRKANGKPVETAKVEEAKDAVEVKAKPKPKPQQWPKSNRKSGNAADAKGKSGKRQGSQ